MLLGLSTRAENVLSRENIHTVAALLAVAPAHFRHLRAVAKKTRKEIVELIADLRARFPEQPQAAAEELTQPAGTPTTPSIDDIAAELLPRSARATAEREITAALLDPGWPKQAEVAGARTRQQVSQILVRARERWKRAPSLTGIRALIAESLATNSGFLEVSELAHILLSARGSSAEGPERIRRAAAVSEPPLTPNPLSIRRTFSSAAANQAC